MKSKKKNNKNKRKSIKKIQRGGSINSIKGINTKINMEITKINKLFIEENQIAIKKIIFESVKNINISNKKMIKKIYELQKIKTLAKIIEKKYLKKIQFEEHKQLVQYCKDRLNEININHSSHFGGAAEEPSLLGGILALLVLIFFAAIRASSINENGLDSWDQATLSEGSQRGVFGHIYDEEGNFDIVANLLDTNPFWND